MVSHFTAEERPSMANFNSKIDEINETITSGDFQIGDILTTVRTDLGDEWALCDGGNVNVSNYPLLPTSKLKRTVDTNQWQTGEITGKQCQNIICVDGIYLTAGKAGDSAFGVFYTTDVFGEWQVWEIPSDITSGGIKIYYYDSQYILMAYYSNTNWFYVANELNGSWTKKGSAGGNNGDFSPLLYGDGVYAFAKGQIQDGYIFYSQDLITWDSVRPTGSLVSIEGNMVYEQGVFFINSVNSSKSCYYITPQDLLAGNAWTEFTGYNWGTTVPQYMCSANGRIFIGNNPSDSWGYIDDVTSNIATPIDNFISGGNNCSAVYMQETEEYLAAESTSVYITDKNMQHKVSYRMPYSTSSIALNGSKITTINASSPSKIQQVDYMNDYILPNIDIGASSYMKVK